MSPLPWLAFAICAALSLQSKENRGDFESKRLSWLVTSGQRHLEYAVDLRKQGMPVQCAEQLRLAVEVSEGKNDGANMVLSIMRNLDDKFWKKTSAKATPGKLETYSKAARKLVIEDQKGELELATWAYNHQLHDEARKEYMTLLKRRDRPLQFDAKGLLIVEGGSIPAKPAQAIREAAIEINGQLYVRDEFLELVPELKKIYEMDADDLRVRSTKSLEEAQKLHAIARQLLPLLEADLGATPTRTLPVVVVDTRAMYESWLDAAGLAEHKIMSGVASPKHGLAVLCSEGLSETDLIGTVLHELTHVFDQATSRARVAELVSRRPGRGLRRRGHVERDRRQAHDARFVRQTASRAALEGRLRSRARADRTHRDRRLPRRRGKGLAFLCRIMGARHVFARRRGQGRGGTLRDVGDAAARRDGGREGRRQRRQRRAAAISATTLFLQAFQKDLHKIEDQFALWLKTAARQ
jgi:hypothetical protein